jgi:hypothetical protein
MAKKPYKWITEERLKILKEEFELYSTKRSVNKACQAVAKRLNVTPCAVYEAIKGLKKHYGHIPTLTPGYDLIEKKKPRKERLLSKPKVLKTNCTKCSVFLTEENRSLTRKTICKTCFNAYTREYRKSNQAKHNQIMKNWRAKNKGKVREMHLKYIIKNYGSLNEYSRNYNSDNIINLKDPYLKMLLSKDLGKAFNRKEMPQDLIDLQRTKLLLIRKIKQSNVYN